YAARIDSAGTLLEDPALGFAVATSPLDEGVPKTATDGAGHTLIAYPAGLLGADRIRTRMLTNPVLGTPCSAPDDCASGHCADGVCCNTPCDDPCDVCSAALGATQDGTCTTVTAEKAVVCGGSYLCDGSSAACPSSCTLDAACASTAYCASSGVCAPKKQPG